MDSATVLLNYNIKPSIIRVMIYDYLRGTKSHPTVDDIYKALQPGAPTLSKTTVYNTVKLFVSAGLVKALSIDGTQIRYDADIGHHGHFRCDKCEKVYDFKISADAECGLEGFDVTKREIFYSGTCNHCL